MAFRLCSAKVVTFFFALALGAALTQGFQISSTTPLSPSISTAASSSTTFAFSTTSSLWMATTAPKKGYIPKWQKKATLADKAGGPLNFQEIGLKGNIPVVFRQDNVTKTTMALAGQPLRDVATQAGQFIKYGCGKGECGTCEALCNGKWIRPCMAMIPGNLQPGEEYVIQVKGVTAKAASSGKFYSFRSFIMGFYNNLLGMVGFVQYRRLADENFSERREYENLIKIKAMEKKKARALERMKLQQQAAANANAASSTSGKDVQGLSP